MEIQINKKEILEEFSFGVTSDKLKISGQDAIFIRNELLKRGADKQALAYTPIWLVSLFYSILSAIESGGNSHMLVGILNGGQNAVLGAVSNNVDSISIKDVYNNLPRTLVYALSTGALIGAVIAFLPSAMTAAAAISGTMAAKVATGAAVGSGANGLRALIGPLLQYGFGKLFGSEQNKKQYLSYLNKNQSGFMKGVGVKALRPGGR